MTMWTNLLLLALVCGGAADLSSLDGCEEGPAYWCRNLMTAVRCGAWEHCMQTGWSQASNQDPCADCKEVVTLLIRLAKESLFKKAVQGYLEEECQSLPLQTLVPRCKQLVETYCALLTTILEAQLKPDVLCAKLSLCPTDPWGSKGVLDSLIPEVESILQLLQGKDLNLSTSQAQDGTRETFPIPLPLCWLCRSFVGRVESIIPKAAIGKAMSQLCRIMPATMAGMCQCLMERYTTIVVDAILGKLGPRLVCGMMLMCATEENCGPEPPHLPPPSPPSSKDGCQACLALSNQVKATLHGNSSKAEAEVVLLAACSKAFQTWQECKLFISQHQHQLLVLLAKPWSAQSTCQELGACPPAETKPFPGSMDCAQGPSFWCSSLSAAVQCKAVQHCQAHVWP